MPGLMLAISLLVPPVIAGPVVLHSEADSDTVRADVLNTVSLMDTEISVTHFDAFRLSLVPALSGGGTLQGCAGEPVSSEELAVKLKKVEGNVSYLELEQAGTSLAEAQQSLLCMKTPIDTAQASRIGFLQGIIALEEQDKSAAWAAFSTASPRSNGIFCIWPCSGPPRR